METQFHCHRCGSGPFCGFKGYSAHVRHCPANETVQILTHGNQIEIVPTTCSQELQDSDLGQDQLSAEMAFFEQMTASTPPGSPASDWEIADPANFGIVLPDDDRSDSTNTGLQQADVVTDAVGVPDVIRAAMFQEPEGRFGHKILRDTVTAEDGVKFRGNMWNRMTANEKSNLHLLKILKGREMSLFGEIQEWRFRSQFEYGLELNQRLTPTTRAMAITELQKLYGYQNLLPRVIHVVLPCTGVTVDLIVFPFGKMFLSLLTDPVAMQQENLYLDPNNPFEPPQEGGKDGYYDDFHTGKVHCEAYRRYCKSARDILAEILLFIDKTHIDLKGKHTLEPVMFTTALFKRKYRAQHQAWRPLGYIPNLDLLAPHAKPESKQQDYHYCLRIIFSELAAYQNIEGLEWTFAFGEKEIPCRLQIPVNCIMGDTDGHDKLCARKLNRTAASGGCLCRYCNVKFDDLGKPLSNERTKLTKCSDIRNYRNRLSEPDKAKLAALGYREFHDGAVDLHFSDPIRGLHGCTPGEILHAFQLGLAERSIESCFGAKRFKRKKKQIFEGNRNLVDVVMSMTWMKEKVTRTGGKTRMSPKMKRRKRIMFLLMFSRKTNRIRPWPESKEQVLWM